MILLRKISQAAKSRIMNDFQRTDRDFAKLGSKLGCASHGEVFILRFIEKITAVQNNLLFDFGLNIYS